MNPAGAPFKAVIFDMDGVIVDSEPHHERAVLEVLEEIGYGQTHGLKISDYVGRSDQEVWREFIARNHPRQTLEELLARKRARTIEILRREQPFFPGVFPFVKRLAQRCPLAVASGSEREVVDTVLGLSEIGRFFSVVVTGSEVARGKPAPDIFLETARRLVVAPEDCWVIEDSRPGVTAALAAGMRVLAMTHTHPAGTLSDATHVASEYGEVERFLLG